MWEMLMAKRMENTVFWTVWSAAAVAAFVGGAVVELMMVGIFRLDGRSFLHIARLF